MIWAERVSAADVGQGNGDCSLYFDGPVEKGDAARLKESLTNLQGAATLCLDSPGGDYFEGLAIIDVLLEAPASIATRIENGKECYSACALIFLAGHYGKSEPRPNRSLHTRAVLGFHGPYIRPGAASYDPKLVNTSYRQGLKAIGALIERSHDELFPESLLGLGLEKGPDAFLMIDSVDLAGRWNIDVFGYIKPPRLTERMVFQACANSMEWMAPGFSRENEASPDPIRFTDRKYRQFYPDFGDEAAWICVADVYDGGAKGLFLDVQWASEPTESSLRPAEALAAAAAKPSPVVVGKPLWQTYPLVTPLSKIAD